MLLSTFSNVSSESFSQNYLFSLKCGINNNAINLSVPSSLYDYYQNMDKTVREDIDFANFVTPEVFFSLANQIRTLIGNKTCKDELFANAVLDLVHQIRYEDNVNETKYPVETIVEQAGKCDTDSFLAASIMKAGGLDVVLLYFKGVHHMNVGVHLPYEPYGTWWWQQSVGYEFDGKKYWVAECTPLIDWKVGDLPPLMDGEKPIIIPIKAFDESFSAQVSSQIDKVLNSSSISIDISLDYSNLTEWKREYTIYGSINPALSNQNIVCYITQDGLNYNIIQTITNKFGYFSFSWRPNSTGSFFVKTSWSGNSDFCAVDSEMLALFLGFPNSLMQFTDLDDVLVYSHPSLDNNLLDSIRGVGSFFSSQISGSAVVVGGEFKLFDFSEAAGFAGDKKTPIMLDPSMSYLTIYPSELPEGLGDTINDQLGLMLLGNAENSYILEVKGLPNGDISDFGSSAHEGFVVINAADQVQEGFWYGIEIGMSQDQVTFKLFDESEVLIRDFETDIGECVVEEILFILANCRANDVVFRDLQFDSSSGEILSLTENYERDSFSQLLVFFVVFAIFLIFGCFIFYFKNNGQLGNWLKFKSNYLDVAI